MIFNEIEMNYVIQANYLNVWNVINDAIGINTEIEIFMEHHKQINQDTLESLIESLGLETDIEYNQNQSQSPNKSEGDQSVKYGSHKKFIDTLRKPEQMESNGFLH